MGAKSVLHSYGNGNTRVEIHQNGTKIRTWFGTPTPRHPESIDVKITNWCDLGCAYCHESSTTRGKHGDLNKLLDILSELPPGVELAIGGGNPLAHPDIEMFLNSAKVRGWIINLTVNQGHLNRYMNQLVKWSNCELIKGLGISVTSNNWKIIKPIFNCNPNVVFHVIAGVNDSSIIETLIEEFGKNVKILILGYKDWGFGIQYRDKNIDTSIEKWYQQLPKYFKKCTLCFDNLAIEQLNVQRLFTEDGWNKFYMGDDFTFTMYIDAVEGTYSPTSRNPIRQTWNENSLLNWFSNNRIKNI